MTYENEYIENERGLIISWTGNVKGEEVIRSYHERSTLVARLKGLRYMITDYSKALSVDLTPNDIEIMSQIANEASKHNHAIYGVGIMPTDVGYGMARMLQSLADDDKTGWCTMVTRTREEAEAWLRANLDENLTFNNPAQK